MAKIYHTLQKQKYLTVHFKNFNLHHRVILHLVYLPLHQKTIVCIRSWQVQKFLLFFFFFLLLLLFFFFGVQQYIYALRPCLFYCHLYYHTNWTYKFVFSITHTCPCILSQHLYYHIISTVTKFFEVENYNLEVLQLRFEISLTF